VSAALVSGQDRSDPANRASVRLGPVALAPALTLITGSDSNVFNAATGPQQDVVATASGSAPFWIRLGRVRLSGTAGAEYLYFRRYAAERGFNGNGTLRFDLPLNRLTPYVEGSYRTSKQRQGFEIDVRARRIETGARAGATARFGARTAVDVSAQRLDSGFADDPSFRGVPLDPSLASKSDVFNASLLRDVTPVTQVIASGEWRRDRFDQASFRNAESQRVTIGFQSDARVNGRALVGYRRFQPGRGDIPEFRGVVASADVGFVFFRRTKVGAVVDRDVAYSYSVGQPYYLLTSWGAVLTHALSSNLAIAGRIGRQRLNYRSFDVFPAAGSSDTGHTYGASTEYRLGRTVRIGGYFDYLERESPAADRNYSTRRFGTSLTYVF
jgi:hypothetical protein